MNWKTWTPFAAAIVAGGTAAKIGYDLIRNGPDGEPQIELREVVVATRDVPAGVALTSEDLRLVRIEAEQLPVRGFSQPDKLVGRILTRPLWPGQPVVEDVFNREVQKGGLQAVLEPGTRAVTLGVDASTGMAGLLQPDARVDVVTTFAGEEPFARTVAQNLRVLAVDGHASERKTEEGPRKNADRVSNVTLQVTPAEAAAIDLACVQGKPRLVLRAVGDVEIDEEVGITLAQLRGEQSPEMPVLTATPTEPVATVEPVETVKMPVAQHEMPQPVAATPVAAPAQPRVHTVQIIRGNNVTSQQVAAKQGDEPAADPAAQPMPAEQPADEEDLPMWTGNDLRPVE